LLTLGRRGKLVVIGAAITLVMIFIAGWLRTLGETDEVIKNVRIEIDDVSVKSIDWDNNKMTVTIGFRVFNNTDKIVTLSKIEYNVILDDVNVGRDIKTYTDVPLVGRAPVYSKGSTVLPQDFTFTYSDEIKDAWNRLIRGEAAEWRVKGSADIETAFSIIPLEFDDTFSG
jgi:LEA14-like dessication related protein